MNKKIFNGPNADDMEIIDYDNFKDMIIKDFKTYWLQGSGDGFIDYYENDKVVATLLIGPNIEYGIYLHYMKYRDEKNSTNYLSLYDRNKLNEVAETAEETYASIGLFLPVDIAWTAIKDFLDTGKTSESIEWITPDDIPEDGNW